jgi:hypothetical protein
MFITNHLKWYGNCGILLYFTLAKFSKTITLNQCCGSMTFWGGSEPGSGSWIRILLFSSLTFKMPAKKTNFLTQIFAYYYLKLHLHHFSKIKSQKKSQNSRNLDFFYYFCMIIEGSESGSIPMTSLSGSGSRMPKNTWIRWIRIRIRNTALNDLLTIGM